LRHCGEKVREFSATAQATPFEARLTCEKLWNAPFLYCPLNICTTFSIPWGLFPDFIGEISLNFSIRPGNT
jgi:hypothetical protein